jgi:antibiotic biosynthesis monooxygenase (ABM) superfamily enzyme
MTPLDPEVYRGIERLDIKTMNTDYNSHIRDPWLRMMHSSWQEINEKDAMQDYEDYLERRNRRRKIDFMGSMVIVAITFIIMLILALTFKGNQALVISPIGLMLLGFAILGKRAKRISPDDDSAKIWEMYENDLCRFVRAFPSATGADAAYPSVMKKVVGYDLTKRGTQVRAKQKAGFLVDADEERNELVELHATAIPFGFVKGLEHYFGA